MRIGLHNHTCFSDGRFSPQVLVERAGQLDYEWLAITDHNTTAGWQSLAHRPAWLVAGIELSALTDQGYEVHILGLGLEPCPELAEHTNFFQNAYDALWRKGIAAHFGDEALAEEAAAPETRGALIERLSAEHGQQRVLQAWVSAHSQVYETALRPRIPHWHEAIAWLRRSQATVGLAHPGRYPQITERDALLAAVDAIEVIHPEHNPAVQSHWQAEAERRGKACWGSHDFHGWSGKQQGGLLPPIAVSDDWLSPARWRA